MEQLADIIWRSALAYGVMLVIARTLGKATVAQMTYHDFVAAITLGALTSNLAVNMQMSFWQLLVALITFSGIAYLLMFLALKNRSLRKLVSGRPTVLIQNGKILEDNMRKQKITLDTLNQELREKGVFSIEEVDHAVLELNGKIAILKKPEYQPVLRKDLKLALSNHQIFPIELIMDGEIIENNLRQNRLTKQWLDSEIKKKGVALNEVNYAVKSSTGQLYIDKYQDGIHQPVDHE